MTSPRTLFQRTVRVTYPLKEGRIVLRTQRNWDEDLEPLSPAGEGHTFTFSVESETPFLYVKPCLRIGEEVHFPPGANKLLLMTEPDTRPIYYGRDVLHFAFPLAEHDEVNWGVRLHLPLQLFSGVVRNASVAIHADRV